MARSATTKPSTTPAKAKGSPQRAPTKDTPTLEWIAAAVGLALAGSAVGLTAWDALFGVKGPPAIEVRLARVTPTSHGYVAEIEAFNHGGAPAAQVEIEGVIAGEAPAGFTIDYIPEQSAASGGLIFQRDPRSAGLTLRAKGFSDAS